MKLFELQKKLNDIDYKANQNELSLKKQLDDDLRKKREDLDNESGRQLQEIEGIRAKTVMLQDKKQVIEQQLETMMN